MTRVLLVDNHDSFTFNIAHLVAAACGELPDVLPHDAPQVTDLSAYTHLIIGPGPGTPSNPADCGHSRSLYREALELDIPVLGVCFGMQLMAVCAGGSVERAPEPMHGRERVMTLEPGAHDDPVIGALPSTFTAVRYHSLAVTDAGANLDVLATAADGTAQALRHRLHRAWGVQFHPESIRSEAGLDLMRAFLATHIHPTHTLLASAPIPLSVAPDELFARFFGDSEASVWLDSASDDARSRFSYLGHAAHTLAHRVGESTNTFVQRLRTELASYRLDADGLAIAESCGGFGLGYAGYIGYGIGEETLRTDAQNVDGLRSRNPEQPDAVMHFLDRALVIDHNERTVRALALAPCGRGRGEADAAQAWVQEASALIETRTASAPRAASVPTPVTDAEIESTVQFRHSRERYLELIDECHRLIDAGESYELCLTNEGHIRGEYDPWEVYRVLRELSRVPYGALLRCGDFSVASASPECFLSVTATGEVESRPIKGTRPRGTGHTDAVLRAELHDSEKDRAENLMIVDLVRNDLSRVCDPGTVHVPSIFAVESFPTVHQLISTVRGTLSPGRTAVDALEVTFPGGSMTGAPKLRTVQLLNTMEEGERGVYSGAIGWVSLSGALSLSIVIRTAVIDAHGATFGVGGAITRLSDPDEEYSEIITKARTVVTALTASEGRPRRQTPRE